MLSQSTELILGRSHLGLCVELLVTGCGGQNVRERHARTPLYIADRWWYKPQLLFREGCCSFTLDSLTPFKPLVFSVQNVNLVVLKGVAVVLKTCLKGPLSRLLLVELVSMGRLYERQLGSRGGDTSHGEKLVNSLAQSGLCGFSISSLLSSLFCWRKPSKVKALMLYYCQSNPHHILAPNI